MGKAEGQVDSAAGKKIPKISIVTPSFNQGIYLEECIRSIFDQEYPKLEYFIIDGGSSDESIQVIQKYADRLAGWVSERDSGQSEAINKGFKRATGELVAWLNADDFYLPGSLKAAAEAYQQNPQAPFFFGDGLRVNEQGEKKQNFFPESGLLFDREALIYGLNYILQPATFIRREALEKAGYLDMNLHYGMDTDLWIRLSALGAPAPVRALLAASREHESTKTATGSFKRLEELRLLAEKHSGMPVTPGYLCYFLDTLEHYTREHEAAYPPGYRAALLTFWTETSRLLAQYNVRQDGFPSANLTSSKPAHSRIGWVRKIKKVFIKLLGKT
jgi:glycosyltransferase involved in cell wall biosynthesis